MNDSRTEEKRLTDEQYRSRFIERLSLRFREDEHMEVEMAQREAEEEYAKCPRSEMADEWKDDPDNCADETWIEWRAEYGDEVEDGEWDGDEDRDYE
jgi:hypothetical protein